jgi:6-phosphogluconolactonase
VIDPLHQIGREEVPMDRASNVANILYVGTFTAHPPYPRGRAEGIYVYNFDPSSVALAPLQVVPDVPSPSFVTLAPDRRHLYSVNAVPEIDGHPGGAVSAFAVDPSTGMLTFLNRQSSHGAGPCHVSVDRTGRWALVANFGGGSVAVLPIQTDGRLGPATEVVQHAGSSVHPERQSGPHAHSLNLDPANRFALVCDLGLDRVFVYRFDAERGTLRPNENQPWVQVHGGAGPRHLAYHPNGQYVYVIDEIDSTLIAFAYDPMSGVLRELQIVSTLPDGFQGDNSCADLHMHPSGRFVYGSNRGHDSIVIFGVDEQTGRLAYVGHEPTRGRTPRNFMIDSTGTLMLVANQDGDNIVAFRIDGATGRLALIGQVAEVPSPTCLKLV